MLFRKNQRIFQYTVVFPLQSQNNGEIYSVRDEKGCLRILKLIDNEKLPASCLNEEGQPNEIAIRRQLSHPNINRYVNSVQTILQSRQYSILVTDYVSAESLMAKLNRSGHLSVFEVKKVVKSILSALQYMHTQKDPIIHNGITLDNIMMDLSGTGDRCILTDFSLSRYLSQDICDIDVSRRNPFLVAPELRQGIKTVQSDIYSVGLVMFQMLFGCLPWAYYEAISDSGMRDYLLLEMQKRPLVFPDVDMFELNDDLLKIIVKATQFDPALRFQSAQELLDAFDDCHIAQDVFVNKQAHSVKQSENASSGKGFDDVAGMQDLKEMLYSNVINILKNRDRAKEYGISIPNGMLLYGPPGCGKSFFAEKFAEETGCFYKYVKASDLASVYIHGSQEKIGNLFDEARKKSPSILCFDEFDALVPKRSISNNTYQAGEVNEFLSQLNNCGKDGVFVIATTNQPDMIDTAVLRKGRIDSMVYLPPPDAVSRQAIFQLHLKNRPSELSIDYEKLAAMTECYVASDIAYIVNEAAIRAFENKEMISQKMLETLISQCKPSLSKATLKNYENMRRTFENEESSESRIGFHL